MKMTKKTGANLSRGEGSDIFIDMSTRKEKVNHRRLGHFRARDNVFRSPEVGAPVVFRRVR